MTVFFCCCDDFVQYQDCSLLSLSVPIGIETDSLIFVFAMVVMTFAIISKAQEKTLSYSVATRTCYTEK